MTSKECLEKIISCPDVSCPVCDGSMSLWTWNDEVVYRCPVCGNIALNVDKERSNQLEFLHGDDFKVLPDAECSFCGKGMVKGRYEGLRMLGCRMCGWVFVTNPIRPRNDLSEAVENIDRPPNSVLQAEVGEEYEKVLKLIYRPGP